MTAPLFLNKEKSKEDCSLHIATNILLNEIDNDNVEMIERYIDKMLKQNISREYLYMLYVYAYTTQKHHAGSYLEEILLVTYNECPVPTVAKRKSYDSITK